MLFKALNQNIFWNFPNSTIFLTSTYQSFTINQQKKKSIVTFSSHVCIFINSLLNERLSSTLQFCFFYWVFFLIWFFSLSRAFSNILQGIFSSLDIIIYYKFFSSQNFFLSSFSLEFQFLVNGFIMSLFNFVIEDLSMM